MEQKLEQKKPLDEKPAATAPATVRVSPLSLIPELLREFGKDPESLFRSLGFEASQFDNPDNVIPYIDGSKLLQYCVATTGCEHFGLLLGKRASSSSLGISGFMLRAAPDVTTALGALQDHIDLHDQGGVITLGTENDFSFFGYEVQLVNAHAPEIVLDLSIAIACLVMRELCGAHWNPTKVLLARTMPKDPSPYQRFFRAPIRFNADKNGLVFPGFWLREKPVGSDPLLFEYLQKQAADQRQYHKHDVMSRLHAFLRQATLSGDYSVAAASRHLGLHSRTLNRRLHEAGTSFRQELKEVRYQVARELLSEARANVTQIAEVLGYSDVAAFIHAFTQWSGTTPKRWQAVHIKPDPLRPGNDDNL